MATHSDRGQVVVELSICAILIAGLLVLGLSLTESYLDQRRHERFPARTSWRTQR